MASQSSGPSLEAIVGEAFVKASSIILAARVPPSHQPAKADAAEAIKRKAAWVSRTPRSCSRDSTAIGAQEFHARTAVQHRGGGRGAAVHAAEVAQGRGPAARAGGEGTADVRTWWWGGDAAVHPGLPQQWRNSFVPNMCAATARAAGVSAAMGRSRPASRQRAAGSRCVARGGTVPATALLPAPPLLCCHCACLLGPSSCNLACFSLCFLAHGRAVYVALTRVPPPSILCS